MEMKDLDKTKMNYTNPNIGRSLIDLINGKDNSPRIARIDTRLGVATHRVSALRSDNYKYVYHVDEDSEEFFDIIKDEYEIENLIGTNDEKLKEQIEFFRNLYNKQNKDIFNYHEQVLLDNFKNDLNKYYPDKKSRENVKKSLLSCTPTAPLPGLELLVSYLAEYFPNMKIDFLTSNNIKNKYNDLGLLNIINLNNVSEEDIKSSEIADNTYDFSIYLTEFSRYRFIDPIIVKALKSIKTRNVLMMDFNFNLYSHMLSRWIHPIKRLLKRNWKYYKGEPLSYTIKDVSSLLYNGIMVNIFNQRAQTFDTEEIKQMRDHKLLSKTQKTPVGEIHRDREKDRLLRLKLSEEED
jgi:hypothetical protein